MKNVRYQLNSVVVNFFLLLLIITVSGCGGGGGTTSQNTSASGSGTPLPTSPAPTTGTVTFKFDGTAPGPPEGADNPTSAKTVKSDDTYNDLIPPGVDAMSTTFYDDRGNVVHGPVVSDASNQVVIENVPTNAATAEIDFLRNRGFETYNARAPLTWKNANAVVDDTVVYKSTPDKTSWKTFVDQNGVGHLQVATNGEDYKEFVVKGVCYSPTVIGYNVDESLDLGDLFWESPKPQWFNDWEKVWRRDIENMRKLGINCIRLYNLSSYHLAKDKKDRTYVPDPANIPNDDAGLFLFTHKKFLDACWNNGDRPIYVIVGMGTHDVLWRKEVYDDSARNPELKANLKFWEANLDKTSQEVGSHPSVLGYLLFNEKVNEQYVGQNPTFADYFWKQVQKHADVLHANSPGKLVSWAVHDAPQIPVVAKPYLGQYGKGIDFFGVNSYQTERVGVSLDTYKRESLGDLARPVVATEFGYPSTGHSITTKYQPYVDDPPAPKIIPPGERRDQWMETLENLQSIFENASTRGKTAKLVEKILPTFYQHPICVGVTYFEWSDEWWKEPPKVPFLVPDTSSDDPNAKKTVYDIPRNPFRQQGGKEMTGFPNGYWDEDGFGIYSISLNGRKAESVFGWKDAGNTNPDRLTVRQELLDAIVGSFKQAETLRPK